MGWVKVADRKPTKGEVILCAVSSGGYRWKEELQYYCGNFYYKINGEATAEFECEVEEWLDVNN